MPLFIHAVVWSFGMHGQTVKLPGQANGKIADIDHFLDLTKSFLQGLTHFVAHQGTQRIFDLAKLVANLPYKVTALGRWDTSPLYKCFLGSCNYMFVIALLGFANLAD